METRRWTLWIWLAAGFLAYLFCNGVWGVSVTAWIFPACFLFVSRDFGPVKGLLLLAAAIFVGAFIHWPGFFAMGSPIEQAFAGIMSLELLAPYIVDRIFFPMFVRDGSVMRRFAGTLIFPMAYATMEVLLCIFRLGNTSCYSLTQIDFLPFIQITSVFGQAGMAFLLAWFASMAYFVIDYIRNRTEKDGSIRKPVSIFVAVFILVFAYGGIRLATCQPEGPTAKIALAHGPHVENIGGEWEGIEYDTNVEHADKAIDKAAEGGAEMVVFNEEALDIDYDMMPEITKFLQAKAAETDMYIVMGFDIEDPAEKKLSRNSIICFSPEGEVLYDYSKTKLIPLMEVGSYEPGDGKVNQIEMDLGGAKPKVSSVICYEGSFTDYMSKLDSDVDIHLNPCWEWKGLGMAQSAPVIIRAVERGYTVLKPTYEAWDTVTDFCGRTIAEDNPDIEGYDSVLFADVPTEGCNTIYNSIGCIADWIYAAGLVLFALLALARRRQLK
ncbi:MAG: nitrilase-related carbon-nitrogen hydrolase [Bacillota bacterium]|nr:nitrilase-related carbon-nitrogen hydrolase [Bacillota bacterium]